MGKVKKENGAGSITYQIRNGRKYFTGRYTVGYDENGKQIKRSISGYNKTEVQTKLKEKTLQVSQGLLSLKDDVTFGDFFREWIYVFKKPNVSNSTFEKYEADYRLRILGSPLENVRLSKIDVFLIRKTVNYWLNNNSLKQTEDVFGRVKTCFKMAIGEKYILHDPTYNVSLPKEKKLITRYQHFTVEQQDTFFSELNLTTYTPTDMLIYIYFASGCRLSEGLAFEWPDFHDGGLDINKQYSKSQIISDDGNKRRVVQEITPLKTINSYRFVPLPDNVVRQIENYRKLQNDYIKNNPDYVNKNLMFPNGTGNYLDRKLPQERVRNFCKKHGYRDLTLHSIRHTYATRLFEKGVSPKVVQSLLGHSKIEITLNVYTHVIKNQADQEVNKLNDLF